MVHDEARRWKGGRVRGAVFKVARVLLDHGIRVGYDGRRTKIKEKGWWFFFKLRENRDERKMKKKREYG